jgi:hypothetical protein
MAEEVFVATSRAWELFGLMRKHFPRLRDEQIMYYSPLEMEELLAKEGVVLKDE